VKATPTSIPDVLLIQPRVFEDARGFFMEAFQKRRYQKLGLPATFVQDNHSGSRQGILRGLHYQIRQPQGKLIRVVVGEIFDVAVDIRQSSPTFGQWVGVDLSDENRKQLWIPPGFAHGFYVLSEWAEVIYKVTEYYAPEWDRTLLWNDPAIGIQWPLIHGKPPVLSDKDAGGKSLSEAELFD
jgi:dTDP-4-dehydrorhamnose 3,5-epimerase